MSVSPCLSFHRVVYDHFFYDFVYNPIRNKWEQECWPHTELVTNKTDEPCFVCSTYSHPNHTHTRTHSDVRRRCNPMFFCGSLCGSWHQCGHWGAHHWCVILDINNFKNPHKIPIKKRKIRPWKCIFCLLYLHACADMQLLALSKM